MVRLAYGLTDTAGRVFYALFLDSGVQGMPPGAEPGTKPERLPPGYGKRFGERLYAMLLQKAKDPDTVESVIADMLLTVSRGKFKVDENTTLRGAEQYVMKAALNHLINALRSKRRMEDINGEGIDVSDPSAFRNLDEFLPRADIQKLLHDLERVDKRAPSWLEAQLDGLKNVELAEEWGVAKSYISNWEKANLPKIKQIVMKYVQNAAAA